MDRQCNVPATYVRGRLSRPVARNGYYLRRVRTVSGREPLIAVRICTWNHGATYGEAALKVQCARKNVSKLGGVGGRAGRQREDRDRRGYNSEPRRAHLPSSPPSDRPRAGRAALPAESLSRPHGAEEQSKPCPSTQAQRTGRPVARNGHYLGRVRTVSGRELPDTVRICTWNHGATYGEAVARVQSAGKSLTLRAIASA